LGCGEDSASPTDGVAGGGNTSVSSDAGALDVTSAAALAEFRVDGPYPPSPYPEENPHTDAKAMLGKILFWEEQVSADDTVACGTCHRAGAGGSDPRSANDIALLPGFDEEIGTDDDVRGSPGVIACDETGARTGQQVQVTGRKAPTYLDAMFPLNLFWDGRAECASDDCPTRGGSFEDPDNPGSYPILRGGALESQAVGPPLSDVEMACAGATWTAIHDKLAAATPLAMARSIPDDMQQFIDDNGGDYPSLFAAAFGNDQTSGPEDEINTRRIAFAIATHERRLRSDQTPYDRFVEGDDDALTLAQKRGLSFFRNEGRCAVCHRPPRFNDSQFHFTGFFHPNWDEGRGAITQRDIDLAKMRTPTLRNVGLRVAGGLLHSGSGPGASLETVLRLYAEGGRVNDPEIAPLITADIRPFEMSDQQLADLIDFLQNALTDPRVAEELPPFDRPILGSE
jgi:cytochrome c peroxidase